MRVGMRPKQWYFCRGSGLWRGTNGDDQRRTAVVWGQSSQGQGTKGATVPHRCPALVGPAVMAAVLQVQVQLQVVLGPRFDPAVGATLTQCTVAAPRVSAPPGHPSCTTNGIVCTYMIRYRIARQIYTQNQIAYTKAKTPLICIQRAPVNAPTNLTRYR